MGGFRSILLVAAAVVLSMCGRGTLPVSSPPTAAEMGYTGALEPAFYYIEGIKAANIDGDPQKAAAWFDRALELDPAHAPSWYAAADNMADIDPQKALDHSRRANALDTANVWYRTQLGRLLIRNDEYGEARGLYEKLIPLSPRDPDNYRMLAALYDFTGKPFDAIAMLDSAEHRLGRIEELASYKLELLVKVRLYARAIAESEALITEYPYKYENYLVLGDLLFMTGNGRRALENFQKALELNPASSDVLISLNEYYKAAGDNLNFLSTARQIFQNGEVDLKTKIGFFDDLVRDRDYYSANYFALTDLAFSLMTMYPGDDEVTELYARHLVAAGKLDEVLALYKGQIASAARPRIEALNAVLDIEAYMGRLDSVNRYSELALEYYPDDVNLYLRRGWNLSYMKHYGEAMEAFDRALRHAPTDSLKSVILGTMGDVYHQAGEPAKCYKSYDRALRLDPGNIMVLNNYAYYLSEEGRQLNKALGMISKVMEAEPGNATYIDTYGWILYKLGRYDEAKKAVQQAIALDATGSSELPLHYGDIMYELGDYLMARVYWRRALDAGADAAQVELRLEKIEGK